MRKRLGDAGGILFLVVAGFAILCLPRLGLKVLGILYPVQVCLALLGMLVGMIIVSRMRNRENGRRFEAWATAGSWIAVPVDRSWPWTPLLRDPSTVTVTRAWQSVTDDLLITVGEARWSDNALYGAVTGWAGQAVFVEVRLPVAS